MGTDTRHREADLAMSQLRTDIILEENVYELSLDNLPPNDHADPHVKIMVHAPRTGWRCIHISNVKEHIEAHFCNYYTFTPPQPPPKS